MGYYRRHSGAAIALADQCFVSGVNFLIVVLLARGLSLESFGVFMVAQLLLTLCTTLQNAAIAQPHNILGAQRTGIEFARLTFVLGVLQLGLGAIAAALAAAIGAVLLLHHSTEYAAIAFALSLTLIPWTAQEYLRRIFYTRGDARGAAGNDFVTYSLQLLGIVLVLYQVGGISATPVSAVAALGSASLVGAVFGLYRLRRALRGSFAALPERHSYQAFKKTCAESWRLSRWLVAQQGVAWLGSSAHGWLLASILGPAAFGLYRAAYQIVNLLNPLRQAAMNFLPSRAARTFAEHGWTGLRRWHRDTVFRLGLPFVVCAIAIVLCAEPLARIFYGRELALPNAQWMVALGVVGYTLNFLRTPLDYTVLAGGGAQDLLVRSIWLALFVLTAGTALIGGIGIYGALISEIAAALLALLLTLRVYWTRNSPAESDESPSTRLAIAQSPQS